MEKLEAKKLTEEIVAIALVELEGHEFWERVETLLLNHKN